MSDENVYCTFCGERAVLIRTVGKKHYQRKEYLCNSCIDKEERGELKMTQQTADNI